MGEQKERAVHCASCVINANIAARSVGSVWPAVINIGSSNAGRYSATFCRGGEMRGRNEDETDVERRPAARMEQQATQSNMDSLWK